MHKISVIIPNYNRAELLAKAIHSVLTQTYLVEEILVCDDGSNDNSKEFVKSISAKDPKVVWIDCGKNGRPAIPRNIGIANAKGEWLAFLDNDDTWQPEKISEQIKLIELSKCKAVCTNANRVIPEQETKPYLSYNNNTIEFNDLLKSNWVICSSMMIHRSLLDVVGRFPESEDFKAIEDYALWIRISTQTSIAYANIPLVDYLDMPASSIRTRWNNQYEPKKVLLNDLLSWVNDRSLPKEFSVQIKNELSIVNKEIAKMSVKNVFKKINKTLRKTN